jgi:glutaredoxin
MKQSRKIFGNAFFLITVLGTLFLLAELIFQFFGSSICHTEGCKVVSRHARFGDISIILIGLSSVLTLAVLSFLTLYRNRVELERYVNLILVGSLAGEGFFTGYQAFSVQTPCLICLFTLGVFLTLGVLRFFYGEKDVVAGFLSFAGVFALFYLILPAESTVNFPQGDLILFYKKDCKYCAEVLKEMEVHKIRVNHVLVDQYTDLLKKMDIEHVPTLYVNGQTQKIFLTGKEAIDRYMFTRTENPLSKKKNTPGKKTRVEAKVHNKTKSESHAPSNNPGQPSNTINQPGNAPAQSGDAPAPPGNAPNPFSDQGMCKDTEKCE